MDLVIRVKEIRGHCPVHSLGDSFKLEDGYRLVTEKPLCMHSLASLLPYYNALRYIDPAQLGMSGEESDSKAYVHCLDPCAYTGGGTTTFEITKIGH